MLDAVLSGEQTSVDGVELPRDWLRRSERTLRRRRDQVAGDPGSAPWLLRAMALRGTRELVGRIGFHGRPGDNSLAAPDALELGYAVEPAFQRQGFAEEAIGGMMAWARARSIDHFVLSIGIANRPSLALAAKLGFAEAARVIDDEDGEDIVFELRGPGGAVRRGDPGPR